MRIDFSKNGTRLPPIRLSKGNAGNRISSQNDSISVSTPPVLGKNETASSADTNINVKL